LPQEDADSASVDQCDSEQVKLLDVYSQLAILVNIYKVRNVTTTYKAKFGQNYPPRVTKTGQISLHSTLCDLSRITGAPLFSRLAV